MSQLRDLRGPVLDGAAFVVCVAAMVVELALSDTSQMSVAAVAAIVFASLPVLIRSRWPAWSAALAILALFAVLTTSEIYQTIALPSMLCGYSLASRRGRGAAIVCGALTTLVVLVMLWGFSPHPLTG